MDEKEKWKTMKLKYKIAIIIAVLAGLSTLVPTGASKPCLLGYYAHCSWTPVSTLICLVVAGAVYWMGTRRNVRHPE